MKSSSQKIDPTNTGFREASAKKSLYNILCLFTMSLSMISSMVFAEGDSLKVKRKINIASRNSLILSGTDYTLFTPTYFPRRGVLGPLLFWRDEHIGVYYNRKVSKKWSLTIGYSVWNNTPLYYDNPGQFMTSQSQEIKVRSIISSTGYKRGDAFINYQIFRIGNQRLRLALGASYTRGRNEVVDSIVAQPGYFDAEIFTHTKKASYLGIVPNLNYDYQILRNRVSIGFDIRYRKYFGFYLRGLESGVHLAVNF